MDSTNNPILLFDGVCTLCNGAVRFIIERDSKARFKFASLQSNFGQAALHRLKLPTHEFDSYVLLDNGKHYFRSTSAIRVYSQLDGVFWKFISAFYLIPTPVRDAVYAWVARNRYKWFGKDDTCMIPTPDITKRFVDVDAG